ncbi:hypothetical protein [Microcoleus sp. Pol7_A1]|uniref:hypothetical protein n=1 Tax=Microcoleus sp. Pol7_A1 TaxID=2818893 RepID=UPI002FD36536
MSQKSIGANCMDWKKCAVMGLLLLGVNCGCEPDQPISVSQENFGDAWPLTVPRGRLACMFTNDFHAESVEVIFFIAPDGKEYLLRGSPMRSEKILLPIDSIHKPDPLNSQAKKILMY